MTTLKVRFDGRVLIPEQPVDLPQNLVLEIHVADTTPMTNGAASEASEMASLDTPPLAGLLEALSHLPDDPNTPTDLAAQHDHYLYGTPKRP